MDKEISCKIKKEELGHKNIIKVIKHENILKECKGENLNFQST